MNVSPYARGMMEFAFLLLLVQSQSSLLAVYLPLCWLKGLQLIQPLRKCWLLRSLRALSFNHIPKCKAWSHCLMYKVVHKIEPLDPSSPTVTLCKDTRSRDEYIKDII